MYVYIGLVYIAVKLLLIITSLINQVLIVKLNYIAILSGASLCETLEAVIRSTTVWWFSLSAFNMYIENH